MVKISINGVVMPQGGVTLRDLIEGKIESAQSEYKKLNREKRRHKLTRKVITVFSTVSALALLALDKAEAADPPLASQPVDSHKSMVDRIVDGLFAKATGGLIGDTKKEDTLIWKMNEYVQQHVLHTFNFFDAPQIREVYSSIWHIMMTFTTLLIAKKGFDMIKSRVLGTTTIGLNEMLLRLFSSLAMTFFSLDLVKVGINFSNASIEHIMHKIGSGEIPIETLNDPTIGLGGWFWSLAYILMFAILGVTYWYRQINLLFLGMVFPVANTAWVVDGGSMLKTLVREIVQNLVTPIAQAVILGLSTVIVWEVNNVKTLQGTSWTPLDAIMIGLSTIAMMITTPVFLRKFITGSYNPFNTANSLLDKSKFAANGFARVMHMKKPF